jgi:hypothetical protein
LDSPFRWYFSARSFPHTDRPVFWAGHYADSRGAKRAAVTGHSSRPAAAAPPVVATLLPIIVVVFIAFLVIGLALPVLPLHVHQGLGLAGRKASSSQARSPGDWRS